LGVWLAHPASAATKIKPIPTCQVFTTPSI
jgi:hypothetical protein